MFRLAARTTPKKPNYSLLHTKFCGIILIMPHSSHLLRPQGIRAKQEKHQEGGTEEAATTARHTLHNKSKAVSCIPTLAIPTKAVAPQRCMET